MARILVVEDEAPLRRIIALNLVRRGYTVIEAESVATAQEALAAFQSPFDLMLLDLNLPDHAGWDVLRALEETSDHPGEREDQLSRQPEVIILTAVRPVRSRLEEFRPAAVLLKPFPIEALLRLIQRVLTAAPAEVAEDAEDTQTSPASVSENTGPPSGAAAFER
jgi:DNA-binding response OmpR family regulator